jgi:DNA polymerase-3 subunit delta'
LVFSWYIVDVVPFDHIRGQKAAVEALTRALRAGLVHHAYRFEGAQGVGKTMAALALAQALLCEAGEPLGCGRCRACRRVVTRSETPPEVPLHPDVVWLERGIYAPDVIGGKKELTSIGIEQIRSLVLSRFGFPPHEGRGRVFIIQRAEELTVQAANALLKSLEEPGDSTYFILLCARPRGLIDTIRSRSLPIRFGPLPDEVLRGILREQGVAEALIEGSIAMAQGSADLALGAADPEASAAREAFVSGVHGAVAAPRFDEAVVFAESLSGDRDSLFDQLAGLATRYAMAARSDAATRPDEARMAAERHGLVLDSMAAVRRNASPKILMCQLLASLRLGALVRPG